MAPKHLAQLLASTPTRLIGPTRLLALKRNRYAVIWWPKPWGFAIHRENKQHKVDCFSYRRTLFYMRSEANA